MQNATAGEIQNIKWTILIGGSSTEKGEHILFGCNVLCEEQCANAYAAAWKTTEADFTESHLIKHSITIQVAMHAMLTCHVDLYCHFISEKKA